MKYLHSSGYFRATLWFTYLLAVTLGCRQQRPTLIQHGEQDTTVPPEQVKQFADELKKDGVRCDLVMYPGQKHAFFNGGPSFYATLWQMDVFLESLGWIKGPPNMDAIHKLRSTMAATAE